MNLHLSVGVWDRVRHKHLILVIAKLEVEGHDVV